LPLLSRKMNERKSWTSLEFWISHPRNALTAALGLFILTGATWVVASVVSSSSRSQFIEQAQLAVAVATFTITALALVAVAHQIWRATAPTELSAVSHSEIGTSVSGRGFTEPSGTIRLTIRNRGPRDAVLTEVRLRWWTDFHRPTWTGVVGSALSPLYLWARYDVDVGEVRAGVWEQDADVGLALDRRIAVPEGESVTLPAVELRNRDPGRYFELSGDSVHAELRIQLSASSDTRDLLWEFTFELPKAEAV